MSGPGALPDKVPRDKVAESPAKRVPLGPALRRAWMGYRRRLDEELAVARFDDQSLPDGRVLRICTNSPETTISDIGRALGITRQGAGKIVASLRSRRYVTLSASATDGGEKIVKLTPRALDYLAAHRKAARKIERELRTEFGADDCDGLFLLLHAFGEYEQPRMREYLRGAIRSDHHGFLED
jgi:DNA-binding MarR family transcriptional regulator